MKLAAPTTAALVLAATLSPAAASAATVTLLEQERFVEAVVNVSLIPDGSTEQVLFEPFRDAEGPISASGFGPFDARAEAMFDVVADTPPGAGADIQFVFVPNDVIVRSATQRSDIAEVEGGIELQVDLSAEGEGDQFLPGGSRSEFRIVFDLDEATRYSLGGTIEGFAGFDFRLTGASGQEIASLDDLDSEELDALFGSSQPIELGESGLLPAGEYSFEAAVFVLGSEGSSGGSFSGLSLLLEDASLGNEAGPTPIPTPGALAAGLTLLAGGLLRRRRG